MSMEIFKPLLYSMKSITSNPNQLSPVSLATELPQSDARQKLEQLSKSGGLALEATATLYPSFAASLLDKYLLGIPLLNSNKQLIANTVESQAVLKDTKSGDKIVGTTVLKGVLGNNYLLHDLEHFSVATDGAPKHISGNFVEMLTTAFHRAIDSFYDDFANRREPSISKASFLTTKDRSPDTFGDYTPYLDKATEIYKTILLTKDKGDKLRYGELINNHLHLNHGMKEAFEELTLHGEGLKNRKLEPTSSNATGFCLTPKALKEIAEIHTEALSGLKNIIKDLKLLEEIRDTKSHLDLISF